MGYVCDLTATQAYAREHRVALGPFTYVDRAPGSGNRRRGTGHTDQGCRQRLGTPNPEPLSAGATIRACDRCVPDEMERASWDAMLAVLDMYTQAELPDEALLRTAATISSAPHLTLLATYDWFSIEDPSAAGPNLTRDPLLAGLGKRTAAAHEHTLRRHRERLGTRMARARLGLSNPGAAPIWVWVDGLLSAQARTTALTSAMISDVLVLHESDRLATVEDKNLLAVPADLVPALVREVGGPWLETLPPHPCATPTDLTLALTSYDPDQQALSFHDFLTAVTQT